MANLPAYLRRRLSSGRPQSTHRRWTWLLVVPLALAAMLLGLAAPAAAQQTLAEIEAEIDEKWRELEPIIEDYNRVKAELKENKEASEELAEQIEPLELHASIAYDELADIAVRQYKAGPITAIGALVASDSPSTFVSRLTALDQLAREQRGQIDEATETLSAYEAQKVEIDALIETQTEQEAELGDRAEAIEEDLAELERLRDQMQQQAPSQTTSTGGGGGEPTGSCPAVTGSGAGYTAATFACNQIGKPYVFGSGGPDSYDCSGLTSAAWAAAGVSLTHYTGAQWNQGAVVDRANLVPGDLVFYYSDLSHVGIYVGGGMIVDAPNSGSTVSMRSVDTMPVAGYRRPG